uniref:Reverse transcriptase n=1 Tax=Tanacetum cinerariifolium TaxID=118510 RepID=A0A699I7Q5_TANCI|nr:reverse transcriptase [Tanacetum cinerariifolium]
MDFKYNNKRVLLRGAHKSNLDWLKTKALSKTPLAEGAQPVNKRPYIHPPTQKNTIEGMVAELLQAGVIKKSNNHFSSIVMVKKKDNSWIMCVDYRQLNKQNIKDKLPNHIIEELIDELHGSQLFTKLDLRSGYHQIRMNEIILDIMRHHKLYAKRSKCVFGTDKIEYLGHVIFAKGVATDPSKVEAMSQWPVSTNIKTLRGFLEFKGGDSRVESVDRTLTSREEVIEVCKFQLKMANNRMKSQADKYKTDRKYDARVGQVAYKLKLPDSSQIHNVFHISQLKKYRGEVSQSRDLLICDEQGVMKVEPVAILDRRLAKRGNVAAVFVLVQLENRSKVDATWEPTEQIQKNFP